MTSPLLRRSSGVLLHPTALPGPFAHGDIGPGARQFVDFLSAAGQSWWQMLPIHPPGGCDSPYDSPSAFAGSESLISLEDLRDVGLLTDDELRKVPTLSEASRANFSLGRKARAPLLRVAYERFNQGHYEELRRAYAEFLSFNNPWVWDYALFMAVRERNGFRSWVDWEPALRRRDPEALNQAHEEHQEEVRFHVFCQFAFHYQWGLLRDYARARGVRLMGDVPMFVSHDSADVWANQQMFHLDEAGHRTVQAGVPPDYFSEDGQLWGNPLYRWDVMQTDGYGWWIDRLRRELSKFDVVRIDHFIALARYWEVPVPAATAKSGRYVEVPGYDFLGRAREAFGGLPFVAEDLGIVTDSVEKLRDTFQLPGMKILQFGFFEGAESYLPHRYPQRCVAYLGTHDNDTTRGWFESLLELSDRGGKDGAEAKRQLARLAAYTGVTRTADVNRLMLRFIMASPANTVILTVQDLLDQGTHSRMNVPGVADGNWTYRLMPGALNTEIAAELRAVTEATGRLIVR